MRGSALAISGIWNQASGVSIIAMNCVVPTVMPRSASSSLTTSAMSRMWSALSTLVTASAARAADGRLEIQHRLPPRPVDAHDHVGAAARDVFGGRHQVAPRGRPLGDRHAVFQVDDDRVGAAPVRAIDEARHVAGT